jgi:hypothetical protein
MGVAKGDLETAEFSRQKNELGKSVAAAQLLDFLLCGLTWDGFNLNNCVLQFLE